MTLSREEIAVRVNEALLAYVEAHGHSPGCDVSMFVGREKCNCGYTELACALRAILLTPTPAPVAPPAGKYVPAVGDVVRFAHSVESYAAVVRQADTWGFRLYQVGCDNPWGFDLPTSDMDRALFIRKATPSELAAAGLAVPPPASPTSAPEAKCDWCGGPHVRDVFHAVDITPAPEAKRPTHVRILKSASPSLKDGEVRRVLEWDRHGFPWVEHDMYPSSGHVLESTEWEPCDAPAPCPPPVAGSAETLPDNVREFLLDVEYAAKWANQPQGPAAEYVKGRLKELAALAHDILSRPVRP